MQARFDPAAAGACAWVPALTGPPVLTCPPACGSNALVRRTERSTSVWQQLSKPDPNVRVATTFLIWQQSLPPS